MASPQQQTARTTPTPAPAREEAPPETGALQDPLLALQDAGGGGNGAVNDAIAGGRAAAPAEPPSALGTDGAETKDDGPGWAEWLQDLVGSETGAVSHGPAASNEPTLSTSTYVGTDQQVTGPDGMPLTSPTSGVVAHDQTTVSAAGWSEKGGTTKYSTTGGDTSTEVDTQTSTLGLGTSSESTTRGWTTQAADAQGTADAVKQALVDDADARDKQKALLDASIAATEAQLAEVTYQLDTVAHDPVAREALSAREEALASDRAAMDQQRGRLVSEAATLRQASEGTTAENAAQVAREHGVYVPAATDTIGTTTTESDDIDWDPLSDGSIGTSSTKTTATEHIGSESSVRQEKQSDALELGDGAALRRTLSSSETHKDGDDETVNSSETSGMAGMVMTADGEVGAKAGISTKKTKGELSTEAGANVQATSNGAKVDGTLGAEKKTKGGLTTGVKTSATGNFSVKVTAIGDDQYQLVTTISGGGSLELSAGSEQESKEHGAKGKASAAVSGGISGSIVMTNTMSAAEATAYLDDLEASESGAAASQSKPEFGILAKLAMLGDQEFGALALVDPNAAKGLGEGDGITMTISANAGLKGSVGGTVGGMGASVKAGATEEGSITYAIKRVTGADGRPRIEISASFSQKSARELGASGSYLSAEMGVAGGRSSGSGYSGTFLLDPDHRDYDAVYAKVMGATSESELKALDGDAQVMAVRASSTTSRSEGSTIDTTAGLGGVKAGMKSTSESSQVVSEGPAGTSGTFTETDTHTGSIGVPGVEVSNTTTTRATGAVSEDAKMSFRVQTGTTAVNAKPGVKEGAGLKDVVTKSPKDNLQALLTETATRLSAYDLDSGQFDKFLDRARDRQNWTRCARSAGSEVAAWEALRGALLSEQPVREFATVDLAQAIALGRMQAVIRFAGRGDAARVVLRQAIFHWTEDLHHPTGTAEDIASLTEFPPSLAGEAPGYHAIAGEMAQLDGKLTQLDAGTADAMTWLTDLTARVNALYLKVEGNTDFVNPRAKMEMLHALTAWQDRLAVARDGSIQGADTTASDPAKAMGEMHRLEEMVRAYKGEEHALFERIRSYMSDEQYTWVGALTATVRAMMPSDEPADSFALMADLYESWIATIKDLRKAYVAAGITEGWLVSRMKGDPRLDDEPNAALFTRLWRQYWSQQSSLYHMGPTSPETQYDMYEDY